MENNARMTTEQLQKLPKDTVIFLYMQLDATLQSLLQNQEEMKKQNEALLKQVTNLQEALLLMRQDKFGRKSEKADDGMQLNAFQDCGLILNEAEQALEDGMPEEPDYEEIVIRRKRKKGKREDDLSALEVEPVDHELSEDVLAKEFPEGYVTLPDEVYQEVVYQPAVFKVLEHHIHVYTDKHSNKILKGPRPDRLLPRSMLSSSMGAAIINAKYVNAVPLNRLSEDFATHDLRISRQTMARWMIKLSEEYFCILYDRMHQELLKSKLIHSDETPFIVRNDRGERKPGAKSYMWVYYTHEKYGSPPLCLYDYCKTRKSDNPEEYLDGYEGILVTDGYEAYHKMERESGGKLKIAGCWAHNKRGFSKLCKALGKKAASGSIAEEAVRQIQVIYHVDNMMKDASPEAILQHRRNSVKPLVDAFFEWAKKIYPGVDKASETGRALTYSLHQEPYLRAFLDDPLIPLDNNDAERDGIRPFTVGRKNWVVIDSINGAEASAILYSIARTAVLNGLKPFDYFQYVLDRMPGRMSGKSNDANFDDLLPWSPEVQKICKKLK